MEEYKLIIDYPNYEVSNYGNVRNKTTGCILHENKNHYGYIYCHLKNVDGDFNKLQNHRLVALSFIKNPLQKPYVDHINNNKNDNNLNNLRWATPSENQQNHSISKANTSGVKGISFDKKRNKWRVSIQIDGINYNLGRFMTLEEAKQARIKSVNAIFGEFTNKCEKLPPKIRLKSTVKLFKTIDDLLNEINQLIHL